MQKNLNPSVKDMTVTVIHIMKHLCQRIYSIQHKLRRNANVIRKYHLCAKIQMCVKVNSTKI